MYNFIAADTNRHRHPSIKNTDQVVFLRASLVYVYSTDRVIKTASAGSVYRQIGPGEYETVATLPSRPFDPYF